MPELTKEYLDKLLDKFSFLISTNKLAVLSCDGGEHVIVELWEKEDGVVSIFPIAKLLTEEEAGKLKLEGAVPKL